jgi:hypothetical protein
VERNIKVLLLSLLFVCCCTGNACASDVLGMSLSTNPAPPFWPGEQVTMKVSVSPVQSGAFVAIQSEHPPTGSTSTFFASGYTDTNGEFTAIYTVPSDAYTWAQTSSSRVGRICFTALCPPLGSSDFPLATNTIGRAQSLDEYYSITQSGPQLPEFPSVVIPVAAIIGLILIFGKKKNN